MARPTFRHGLSAMLMAATIVSGMGVAHAHGGAADRADGPSATVAPAADAGKDSVGECLFLVFSNPVAGREEEFERWYTGQHVADVVNAAGFDTGRRYKLSGEGPHRYLALYQVKCDNPAANVAALHKSMESGNLKMSDAFDFETAKAMLFLAHSPLVKH